MATVKVEGKGEFQVENGTKLVLALEDNGVDILHRCGGNAKCTTCRVEVLEGDAGPVSEKEKAALELKGGAPDNVRLSCQVHVEGDLTVRALRTASESGLEPGPRPEE
ncbi:2Fe-2S iron-sulfur cluster-binding protein [Paenibacillus aurantius]|uniref:2Fe-2S iron-sulfur cluster-binding protein n=1 Tax=Paenibacillus aurantius TaxID=2918900 RepID=A0AA96LA55_9BACL|nr:2Fe-2S iron-sulfur cluster-binding protein [Paenibacillus aurantius]WJH34268.1 (2Fe-2S)-binding protein [Paenibacillus sp. CC-CFT747]WNQ09368.1 2Fe-2S iron-sulfur cluster-binding protein [Paenibacillus aurantius]